MSGQYCSAVLLPCSPGECKNMSKAHVGSAVVILVDRILLMAYVYFNKSWVEMCGMHNIIYMSRVIHFNCYLQCITYFFMAGHSYAPGSYTPFLRVLHFCCYSEVASFLHVVPSFIGRPANCIKSHIVSLLSKNPIKVPR